MNSYRLTIAKYGKKLLIFCVVVVVIACSTAFLSDSHAFAATKLHTSGTRALKSMHRSDVGPYLYDDFIGPALNYQPGCGTGWDHAYDTNFVSFSYSYTTGGRSCTSAYWNDSGHSLRHICDLYVYIPSLFASASIAYGIVDAYGTERSDINQNNVSGWQLLGYGFTDVGYVYISSNNGQNGTDMAAAQMEFRCYG